MARMFVRYKEEDGGFAWGELKGAAPKIPGDQVQINRLGADLKTTADLVAALDAGVDLKRASQTTTIAAAALASPVTVDGTIACQGLNYQSHSTGDAGIHDRKDNLIFFKASSTLCGPYDDIVKPAIVEMLDYEVEVGLVLRRPLKEGAQVGESDLGDYIAGAVLCNDISARDVMFGATYMQWTQGKSYRTFLPTGPVFYWLEKGEVAKKLENLKITLGWRGEQRQEGVTSQMIFKPAETLTLLATIMDLKRGDLLLTGTPGGVIAKGTPKINEILKEYLLDDRKRKQLFVAEAHATVSDFMRPGDIVTAEMSDEETKAYLGGQYSVVV